jgi:hypothetical protein
LDQAQCGISQPISLLNSVYFDAKKAQKKGKISPKLKIRPKGKKKVEKKPLK